jgi:hypothetical protein
MGFSKRVIVKSKKGFEKFLNGLLAMKKSILHQGRLGRKINLCAAKINSRFFKPGLGIREEDGIKRHIKAFLPAGS